MAFAARRNPATRVLGRPRFAEIPRSQFNRPARLTRVADKKPMQSPTPSLVEMSPSQFNRRVRLERASPGATMMGATMMGSSPASGLGVVGNRMTLQARSPSKKLSWSGIITPSSKKGSPSASSQKGSPSSSSQKGSPIQMPTFSPYTPMRPAIDFGLTPSPLDQEMMMQKTQSPPPTPEPMTPSSMPTPRASHSISPMRSPMGALSGAMSPEKTGGFWRTNRRRQKRRKTRRQKR